MDQPFPSARSRLESKKLLHTHDPNRHESNRLLLASWAMMARLPYAADFVRQGRLPEWYLGRPCGVPADPSVGAGPVVVPSVQ